jgi:hypothetical protein
MYEKKINSRLIIIIYFVSLPRESAYSKHHYQREEPANLEQYQLFPQSAAL